MTHHDATLPSLTRKQQTLRLTKMAMLVAISSVLVFASFPIVPTAPFLKCDFADVPILLAAFAFGAPSGLLVLVIAAAVQAFLLGHDGVIGFLMHVIASGTMVLVIVGLRNLLRRVKGGLIIALIAGALSRALIMIPLNFMLTPKVMMDVPVIESTRLFFDGLFGGFDPTLYSELAVNAYQQVSGLMLVGLIPFNLIQAGVNCLLFLLLFKSIGKLLMGKDAVEN